MLSLIETDDESPLQRECIPNCGSYEQLKLQADCEEDSTRSWRTVSLNNIKGKHLTIGVQYQLQAAVPWLISSVFNTSTHSQSLIPKCLRYVHLKQRLFVLDLKLQRS
jgi:hypothetical protein